MAVNPLHDADPEALGAYRLVGRLGEGGMGIVYLGQSERGAPVAVKVLRGELLDSNTRQRFERELEAALLVQSPFTAGVIDADLRADPPYLVTEYVAGETLRQRVDRTGPLAGDELRAVAAGLAAGLAAVHSVRVVHRDVSPQNIVLSPTGPRLIDLGIAFFDGATRLTSTGMSYATPAWASPEQAQAARVASASDVFSWASVVAYAATGRPPFGTGRADAVLYRVVHDEPDVEGVPDWLRTDLVAALEKNPEARPSAEALARVLSRTQATEPLQVATARISDMVTVGLGAWPTGGTDTESLAAQQDATMVTSQGQPDADATQRRSLRWAVPLTVLAVLALVGTWWISREPTESSPPNDEAPEAQTEAVPGALDAESADVTGEEPHESGEEAELQVDGADFDRPLPEGEAFLLDPEQTNFRPAGPSSHPIDLAEDDCHAAATPRPIRDCIIISGSGGTFGVFILSADDTPHWQEVRVYRRQVEDPSRWSAVLETDGAHVHQGGDEWGVEYWSIELDATGSAGEPAAMVVYEHYAAHGPPLEIELVSWENHVLAPEPAGSILVNRAGWYEVADDGFIAYGPNYDDGAPGCCPNFQNVWHVVRTGLSEWTLFANVEPIDN